MNFLHTTYSPSLRVAALLLAVFMFTSCEQGSTTTTKGETPSETPAKEVETPATTPGNGKTLQSVPSPIQMAFYLLNSKAPYNQELMNPTQNTDKYSNSFLQAINLGIYQADLGYIIAHEQTQEALNYFESVNKLGDKLGIFGAFEKGMIERAEDNLDQRDSLFAITTDAFKDAETYLNQNAQPEVADLIVIGGWLESTFLATQTLKTSGTAQLRKRIGDDKTVLPRLLKMMETHGGSKDFLALASKLRELTALYDKVTIKRTYKPAETDKENKVTRITSTHKVRYSKDLLMQITEKVAEIRNAYTN